MYKRIDASEHPDRWGHVSNASPHGKHGSSMVVCLEEGGLFTLGKNDGSVEDLVELGEVKDPTIIRKSLVPDPTNISGIGHSSFQPHRDVGNMPSTAGRVICSCTARTSRSVKLAKRVRDSSETVVILQSRPRVSDCPDHAGKCPRGVQGKQHVVRNNKDVESRCLTHGPRLVIAISINAIDASDGDGIDQRYGYGPCHMKHAVVDIGIYVERVG